MKNAHDLPQFDPELPDDDFAELWDEDIDFELCPDCGGDPADDCHCSPVIFEPKPFSGCPASECVVPEDLAGDPSLHSVCLSLDDLPAIDEGPEAEALDWTIVGVCSLPGCGSPLYASLDAEGGGYCSDDCRKQDAQRPGKSQRKERVGLEPRKQFVPGYGFHLAPVEFRWWSCQFCGRELPPNRKTDRRFCGSSCRAKAHRRRLEGCVRTQTAIESEGFFFGGETGRKKTSPP